MNKVIPQRYSSLWLAVSLILLVCLVRMIGIAVFPPFIDETIHIHTGEIILQNRTPFQNVVLGRQLTIWWIMLFQPVAAAMPMWVARVAVLLAVLPGFAALLSIARQSAGRWAMLIFGLLYIFSTYHMFFERLALADPVAGSLVALAIYFAFRLSRRINRRDAIITGVLLFTAFFAKSSATPDFGVALAAALALSPAGRTWRSTLRDRLTWLAVALGTGLGLTVLLVVGLRLHGYDIVTNTITLAVSGRGTVDFATIFSLQRVLNNIAQTFSIFSTYFGVVALLLLLLGVLILILLRQWYLPLCLFGPVVVIWLSAAEETRYYITPSALLFLCAAIGFVTLTRLNVRLRWGVLALIALWGLITWLPFTFTADRTPAALPLPVTDYQQYITSDASGFGFAEVYSALRDRQPKQVFGVLSNCQGLRLALPHNVPITCPLIRPNGQDKATLAALFQANRSPGTYVILEASPYVPSTAPGTAIDVIDANCPRLTIYDLAP